MSESISITITLAANIVPHAARYVTAISPEADAIRRSARAVIESTERSFALFGAKSAAISEIWTLVADHAETRWDGDEAHPISHAAARLASELIRALPNDLPLPEFAPEPDGSISLDWIHSRTRLLSISASDTDRLAYAWLDGTDRGHGVARFDGETIPPRILSAIREIALEQHASIRVA